MSELPPFGNDGLLPAGDYALTISELRASALVRGRGRETWDSDWRAYLVDNLDIMAQQLREIGIHEIFVNGSFVEDKDHPNDIDGYFVCDLHDFASGRIEQELNRCDPHRIWTWDPESRSPYGGYPKLQLPMWHQYRVELYPHYGQFSGIRDEHGHELEFPAAFRLCRHTNRPKGIVKLITGGAQ